ncbi:DUF3251 domain-containing protein [Shigella flexneri]|nr:DUF3251 domain-containing protein [Shigella flexneri]
MNLKKIFFSAVTVSVLCALTGCDYIEEGKPESSLLKQQEEHNNKIVLLEKQQAQLKSQLETIQKQQTGIINSTKTLTHVIKSVKDQQNTFIFTEFNPAKTKYFILNNGSVALAGRVLSIDATENGSVIHISLVNLLSTPISNIGFNATWGGEKPVNAKEFARWQQLLFNTSMKSTLKLLPGQWQDINLTLKGVSPNNLGYLKLAINMENIQFDNLPSAENRQKRSKK